MAMVLYLLRECVHALPLLLLYRNDDLKDIRKHYSHPSAFWVAEMDGEVVGCTALQVGDALQAMGCSTGCAWGMGGALSCRWEVASGGWAVNVLC